MKDKYLKPFSVEMYNEIESNPDFKIVNGKNEEVIIVDTNVSIHGEPGHVLYWIDGNYFIVDRNGKHAESTTSRDLYIRTPSPYKPATGKDVIDKLENVKEIMDQIAEGMIYGIDIQINRNPEGDIMIKMTTLRKPGKNTINIEDVVQLKNMIYQ